MRGQFHTPRESLIPTGAQKVSDKLSDAVADRAAERATAVATVKFEVGKTYCDRSSCDWDTIYSFEVIARTEKTLTIKEHGKTRRRGIYVYNGVEQCKPHGTYSMCAVIRADRKSP